MVLKRGGHGDTHDGVLTGGQGPWPVWRCIEHRTYVADMAWQHGSEIEASRGQQKDLAGPTHLIPEVIDCTEAHLASQLINAAAALVPLALHTKVGNGVAESANPASTG